MFIFDPIPYDEYIIPNATTTTTTLIKKLRDQHVLKQWDTTEDQEY